MPLVAGVDSSTSSCKVEVRDADTGELVAAGRAPHPPTTPPRSEQDPRQWWSAFEAACAEAGVLGRNRPAAIAVGGQQHGLVVLDAGGAVLRPAKLWNDTESAEDAEALVAALGAAAWAEACGSEAVVVTLDTAYLGWRPRDLDLGHLPFARGEGIAQYTSDPVFRRLVEERVGLVAPVERAEDEGEEVTCLQVVGVASQHVAEQRLGRGAFDVGLAAAALCRGDFLTFLGDDRIENRPQTSAPGGSRDDTRPAPPGATAPMGT